jgi:outer membrane protein assembly factor BamB
MSAERLVDMLQQRRILSDRLMVKLRAKIAETDHPMSATMLAKFLVQKKHLSRQQATELLEALATEPDDEGSPGDSSIFGSLLSRRQSAPEEPPRHGSDDEIGLAPIQPEVSQAVRPPSIDDRSPAHVAPLEKAIPLNADTSPAAELRDAGHDRLVPRRRAGKAQSGDRQRLKKKPKRADEWDSPLLLIGSGVFILLVLCGAIVAWILRWESGEDLLKLAQAASADGSYTQAISQYEKFLDKFPSHQAASSARVELAMARLRQATETSSNYAIALEVAQDELREIEDQEKFTNAHAELAALLPRIAQGLANQAERAADQPDEAMKFTNLTNDALALCLNTKYLPKSYRDEAELDAIEETLASVSRYQESRRHLDEAMTAMEAAISSGDTRAAYAAYAQLVQQHPELAENQELTTRLVETSAAERAGVKFVAGEQPAATTDRPTPWVASLAVGRRHGGATAPDRGTFCALVDGAVYAVDVATGKLLWRRYIGFANTAAPTTLGDDVLVVDSKYHELLRLDAPTGQFVWRQELGEPFAAPLVVGGRAYVAAESGRLYVIDLASGDRMGYVEFAQPLRVSPAVDRRGERLYLTGDHSSVYCLSLRDLTCLGVYYLGHASGNIRVPPAHVLDKLAVVEIDGVATCRLRLCSLDDEGAVAGVVAERRLNGLAASPPLVAGRRVIVVTDRGELDVFDVGAGNSDTSLTLVATREATEQTPLTRHVAVTEGAIWVGDTQLTKYSVLPTGNRLPVQSIDDNFAGATFDHSFQVVGTTLLHVRRPAGRAGAVIGAMNAESGRRLWETEVAVAPAASPVVDSATQTLAAADVNGSIYRFDEPAMRSRVQDQPLAARSAPPAPTLTAGVDLGSGRAAFAAPGVSDHVLLYSAADGQSAARWVKLPSVVACPLSRFGDGVVVPLEIGQVFFLDPANGERLAAPFQPRLQPRTKLRYQSAGQVDAGGRQFVISDGNEKIYLVALVEQPQPQLAAVAEASVGPYPIASPITVIENVANAVTEGGHLARFGLPDLKPAGETDLPAGAVWGPFRVGNLLLLATADDRLLAVRADGNIAWNVALEGGDLAGPPLAADQDVLVAFRNGRLERHGLSDGSELAVLDVEHPLAAGPVRFGDRIVLTAHDGTLLIVDQP